MGWSTLFPPPNTIDLSDSDLTRDVVSNFIAKYAGDWDGNSERKSCWAEKIQAWLQSMDAWTEDDFLMNTRFYCEVWNDEEADYCATK